MRKVTINGREYNIGYNMNTAIAYERMTGKNAFELQQFQDGKLEPQLALGYAMLLSCNDPATLPDMEEMLQSITDLQTMNDFLYAIADELKVFFKVGKDEKPAKDADEPKNA